MGSTALEGIWGLLLAEKLRIVPDLRRGDAAARTFEVEGTDALGIKIAPCMMALKRTTKIILIHEMVHVAAWPLGHRLRNHGNLFDAEIPRTDYVQFVQDVALNEVRLLHGLVERSCIPQRLAGASAGGHCNVHSESWQETLRRIMGAATALLRLPYIVGRCFQPAVRYHGKGQCAGCALLHDGDARLRDE